MTLRKRLVATAAVGAIAVVAAGCGATGTHNAKQPADTNAAAIDTMTAVATTDTMASTDAMTSSAASNATAASDVTVDLAKDSPFSLVASVSSVPAGKVTFTTKNDGTMTHELVILETDQTIQQLTQPDGRASEKTNVKETGDIMAGGSKSITLDMKPGHYWLICNIPGHFAGGMYQEFMVT